MVPWLTRFDRHVPADLRRVPRTASVLGIGEYKLFQLAYRWHFEHDLGTTSIETSFSDYLRKRTVPPWLTGFCKRVLYLDSVGQLDRQAFGLDPRPPTHYAVMVPRYSAIIVALAFLLALLLWR